MLITSTGVLRPIRQNLVYNVAPQLVSDILSLGNLRVQQNIIRLP